jgi:peptide/nickel transport system substrate-binding protein
MNIKILKLFFISLSFFLIVSCNSNKLTSDNRVVIGISSDVQTFNSLFAFSYEESTIADILYPGLLDLRWNDERGELDVFPLIAESWQWSVDSSFIKFILKEDVLWSDGVKLTSDDIVFSYDVYSDPDVQSRLLGTFNLFYINENGHVDIEKSFKVLSDHEIEMHFPRSANMDMVKIVVPIVPKHIFENIKRTEIGNHESNFNPVSCGAFKLNNWNRNQSITLVADTNSFLYTDGQVNEIIFKVIPDYTSKILQLKKGEIDLIEYVKVEDANDLKAEQMLFVDDLVGREYDYIGWNNVDPDKPSQAHKLFGSNNVRKALSMAINRKEILEEYLLGKGILAAGPVSPIFKSVINKKVNPYEFNPVKAKELLKSEGWMDQDKNGVIEKGKTEFKFTMYYPVGNPLREYASIVVKNNLKAVGVEVIPEKMEMGTFIDNLFERKLDSWMAGWGVVIPLELKPYWYSVPEVASLNFVSYGNIEADNILDLLETKISKQKKNELVMRFQERIHYDEPVTFLYWTPNIVVYNKRIKNLKINPYGVIAHCNEWMIN